MDFLYVLLYKIVRMSCLWTKILKLNELSTVAKLHIGHMMFIRIWMILVFYFLSIPSSLNKAFLDAKSVPTGLIKSSKTFFQRALVLTARQTDFLRNQSFSFWPIFLKSDFPMFHKQSYYILPIILFQFVFDEFLMFCF